MKYNDVDRSLVFRLLGAVCLFLGHLRDSEYIHVDLEHNVEKDICGRCARSLSGWRPVQTVDIHIFDAVDEALEKFNKKHGTNVRRVGNRIV